MSRIRAAVAKAASDNKAAKEDRTRQNAQDAQVAGTLVTSGSFGGAAVEIFAGGYVRVGTLPNSASPPKLSDISLRPPGSITKSTPYEKLRSIAFSPSAQDRASGSSSALEGAVGPAVANLLKGGKSLMKGTAPGLAAAAVAHVAGAGGRKAFLTIATDKQIHTLISTINGGQKDVGLALEVAGRSVLPPEEMAAQLAAVLQPASRPGAAVVDRAAAEPTLASRLRELADLHKEGILSDEEFALAKATLLGSL